MAHELRITSLPGKGRSVGWSTAGGIVIPFVAGGILATWVLLGDDPILRGSSPAPALFLLLAVSLTVTAVPVLARILDDQGIAETRTGRLAMTVAVLVDAISWLLVALAIGLAAGGSGSALGLLGVLFAGLVLMYALRKVLSAKLVTAWCARYPRGTVAAIAVLGLAGSDVMQRWGLTEIFGAVLVGFAIPSGRADHGDSSWTRVVTVLSRAGRVLVPVFFVITGITVFAKQLGPVHWLAIVLATGLAVVGKIGGGYVGARFGGEPSPIALRVGVLLNTRGLTELVVIKAGYSAGILTQGMFLALLVMALVTTAMTSPAYTLLDRRGGTPTVAGSGDGRAVRRRRTVLRNT